MAITISLKDVNVSGDAQLLNDASLAGEASVELERITVNGNAIVLNDLTVQEFCNSITDKLPQMSPEERKSIEKVMRRKKGTRKDFLCALKSHVLSFSEGVAASIVAGLIAKAK